MPFRKIPVSHFIKISSSLFKTHLLVSTWKANSWRWELNFETTGHQKYSHHIDKNWQTTITVHKNIGLRKEWPATRCSPSKACANGLELGVESSLLPSEESSPQGILEAAGRPSPACLSFPNIAPKRQGHYLARSPQLWALWLASCFLPKGLDSPGQMGLK